MEQTAKSPDSGRRSTRIRAQIPLRITSLDPAIQLSESCHTLVVNPHGCGVRLPRPLDLGVSVRLDELPGNQSVTARVATCIPLGTENKYWLVGLALDQAGNVWCVHPAPADWDAQPKPLAAVAGAASSAKKGEWPYSQFSNRGEFHPGRK
jgi:hypothetical protein